VKEEKIERHCIELEHKRRDRDDRERSKNNFLLTLKLEVGNKTWGQI
jgi:hypothetical protein